MRRKINNHDFSGISLLFIFQQILYSGWDMNGLEPLSSLYEPLPLSYIPLRPIYDL